MSPVHFDTGTGVRLIQSLLLNAKAATEDTLVYRLTERLIPIHTLELRSPGYKNQQWRRTTALYSSIQ